MTIQPDTLRIIYGLVLDTSVLDCLILKVSISALLVFWTNFHIPYSFRPPSNWIHGETYGDECSSPSYHWLNSALATITTTTIT